LPDTSRAAATAPAHHFNQAYKEQHIMMQKITAVVTGNVVQGTEDLVIRQAGTAKVLNFTIASNNFAPAGKERTTSFIRVRAFNRDAEILARYLTKGKPLSVTGRMELRPYESNKYCDEAGTCAA
jgi:single-strand DNA-binding protein